jgi:hypothetical protein
VRQAADGRMDTQPYRAIAVGLILLAGLVCGMAGCGSGGGDDGGVIGGPITASFTPSGTVSSPDLVRLTGSASNDLVTLQVVIAGQTASDDLFAFAFDLVLSNVALVGYIAGSEEFETALTLEAGQSGVALARQTADRVTVGVAKLGGGAGNGIGPGEKTIVTLLFRVMAKGTGTIAIDTTPPAEPGALESDESPAPGVSFDGLPALISGS